MFISSRHIETCHFWANMSCKVKLKFCSQAAPGHLIWRSDGDRMLKRISIDAPWPAESNEAIHIAPSCLCKSYMRKKRMWPYMARNDLEPSSLIQIAPGSPPSAWVMIIMTFWDDYWRNCCADTQQCLNRLSGRTWSWKRGHRHSCRLRWCLTIQVGHWLFFSVVGLS